MLKKSALLSDSKDLRVIEFGYEDSGKLSERYMGVRNYYVIVYVLEGEGSFRGERISAGEGFITRPVEFIDYYSDKNLPWKCFWIIIDGSNAEKICQKYISPSEKWIFSYGFRPVIADFIATQFSDSDMLTEAHALYLLYYLLSKHETETVKQKNRYVEEARLYIQLHFSKNITVKDVASAVNVSDRYLYNLFIKHIGISPKQVINDVRLRCAMTLLERTSHTITEIAMSVGFSDVLSFSRFFSKNIGLSPTAYRRLKTDGRADETI